MGKYVPAECVYERGACAFAEVRRGDERFFGVVDVVGVGLLCVGGVVRGKRGCCCCDFSMNGRKASVWVY